MLPYLEQGPLYNAANFSWVSGWALGYSINSTVTNTTIAGFICPSDGLSPIAIAPSPIAANDGANNNYFASLGTSTQYWMPDTTGVFTYGDGGKMPGHTYGVQNITDGTSNTIAYGEALVGDFSIQFVKWRDGPQATQTGVAILQDASTNPAGVLTDLQNCAGCLSGSCHQFRDQHQGDAVGAERPQLRCVQYDRATELEPVSVWLVLARRCHGK